MNAGVLYAIQKEFIGRDTRYQLADGTRAPQHYLDSTASALMMKPAFEMATEFLRYYANVHSTAHFSARNATRCFRWAQERVLKLLNADQSEYVCIFVGAGATAALNRVAQMRARAFPERNIVLASLMEHHSNDLPHRLHVGRVVHIGLREVDGHLATVDLTALERLLHEHGKRVNYVAITGVSNVTGLINPLKDICSVAADHGVPVIVDGAQMVPHMPLSLSALPSIAAVAFSGHKLYAPGSPGVLVAHRKFLESVAPVELGGGMVESVLSTDYLVSEVLPDREHAGTPNIWGAVLLGGVCHILQGIGMQRIFEEEQRLLVYLNEALSKLEGIRVYGHPDRAQFPRVAALAFNVKHIPHALAAAVLNDYFGIAVRNECFCAHPYVRELLLDELWELEGVESGAFANAASVRGIDQWKGMLRASIGLYTTPRDIDALVDALRKILADRDYFTTRYEATEEGSFRLLGKAEAAVNTFQPDQYIDRALKRLSDVSQCAIA